MAAELADHFKETFVAESLEPFIVILQFTRSSYTEGVFLYRGTFRKFIC